MACKEVYDMNDYSNFYRLKRIKSYNDPHFRQISCVLSKLRNEYPGFHRWFNTTVKVGLSNDSRQVWIAISSHGEMAGILILKKQPEEKKICTLYVLEKFRNQGIGTLLMKTALKQVGTDKPLATVSSNHINEYSRLLKKYQFLPKKIYKDYYRSGVSEISFNGELLDTSHLLEKHG